MLEPGNCRSRPASALPFAMAALVAVPCAPALAAAHEKVLYTFQGLGDGAFPRANLVADNSGNLYGTTFLSSDGYGVVFEIAPDGAETVLYAFTGGSDGSEPYAGLIRDKSGNLYGTTELGGATNLGTVFELTKNKGKGYIEAVLHSFAGGSRDGEYPSANLIADKQGNLYGTTEYGGNTNCSCGTVFELKKNKGKNYTETVLHNFAGVSGSDGALPEAGLIEDKEGNLFGTTLQGGVTNCSTGNGCGTVFKLAPDGTETLLYAFSGQDGLAPRGSLIEDSAGYLYGTTVNGDDGNGVVFEIAPNGRETTVHAFTGGRDGTWPQANLFADKKGNLYGTTEYGGSTNCYGNWGCGTVFELMKNKDRSYTETVLHSFTGGSDGALPYAGLIKDTPDGKAYLFGTTLAGGTGECSGFGSGGCGVVFEIKK